MYFCTSSLPASLMKVAFVCSATALATRVFPVPGGPWRSTPLGGSIPTVSKRWGSVRGSSTASRSSRTCSWRPPTSSYVTPGDSMTSAPYTLGSTLGGRTPTTLRLCWLRLTRLPGRRSSFSRKSAACTTKLGPVLDLRTRRPSSRMSSTYPTMRGGDLSFSISDLRCLSSRSTRCRSFSAVRTLFSRRRFWSLSSLFRSSRRSRRFARYWESSALLSREAVSSPMEEVSVAPTRGRVLAVTPAPYIGFALHLPFRASGGGRGLALSRDTTLAHPRSP